MAHRASVNQVVQLGVETTAGTTVAANKLLEAFSWTFGDKPTTKTFTATGRKHPGAQELLAEYSAGKISGQGCYQTLAYIISSVYGKVSPAAHSPSVTAYDWTWTPALSGAYSPQTYTLENGDANDAEKYGYVLFSGWGYEFTRRSEMTVSGDWFSQTFSDGITLTASPTAVTQQPITGAQANVYLDSTSGGIGGTQLTNLLKAGFAASNYYGQFWPVNRTNASFTSHIDLMPKNELKLTLEADSTALTLISTYLRTGARAYIRVDCQGGLADAGNSIHYELKHDMACFMTEVGELSDVDGIYAYEITFEVAEDTGWSSGTAQKLVLTNLLSTL